MGTFGGLELADLTLTSDRLELRRWRPDDAQRVLDAMQDPAMRDFLPLPDPYDRERADQFVAVTGHKGRDDGTGLGCAVVERASGRVVGSAALLLAGRNEIAYWIASDARGRGYAAEATRVLASWGFGVGLARISLGCDVQNLASIRTAMAAGFAFEGVARDAIPSDADRDDGARHRACRSDLARFARLADDSGEPIPPAFPPLPDGGLSDGVLTLRAMRPSDAAAFHETEDEESVRWSFDGLARSLAVTTRAATHAGLNWLVGREAHFAMQDVATGAFAGELQLRLSGPPQIAGLGYVVHPAFRGRGFTTRALRLVVPWAFESAGLARLELGAKGANLASQRAARSAGFEPAGVLPHRLRNADGTFADEVRFALINPAPLETPPPGARPA